MPSFSVPLLVDVADPDPAGPVRRLVRARLTTSIEIAPGRWVHNLPFVLDTGATYTTMSATRARSLGIPFPLETSRVGVTTAAGPGASLVHDGELRVRFPQFPNHTFRLYCVFAQYILPSVPPVFGLNDFLDVFRITLDGRWTRDAPAGHILFETV